MALENHALYWCSWHQHTRRHLGEQHQLLISRVRTGLGSGCEICRRFFKGLLWFLRVILDP